MWQKTSSNKTCPASMCVCLCYKPRKRHLPLPKNAKFRGSETQLHSFVLWRFGSSPALCVRAAFTSSAGGTGHDQKCATKTSQCSHVTVVVPTKTGWLIGFFRCSVLCEQWLVCHPCSRSLTLTVLYSSTFQLLGTNPLQFRESRNTFLEVWTFAMRNMSDAIFIIHHWDWQLLKPASINSISLDNQDPAAEGCRRGQFTIHVSVRSDDCPYCPWLDVVMPFSMSVGLAEALWLPSGYHCFTRYSRQHGHGEKSFWDLDLEICRHLPSFVGFRATIS